MSSLDRLEDPILSPLHLRHHGIRHDAGFGISRAAYVCGWYYVGVPPAGWVLHGGGVDACGLGVELRGPEGGFGGRKVAEEV